MNFKDILTKAGFVVGVAALALQFALTMWQRIGNDDTIFGAVVFFFTFFTILTNLALVLIYAAELWPRPALAWFRTPVTRGMMAAVMTLVCVFYHFFLAETWDPQGLAKVADIALHYVTPILYVLWWGLFARHGMLRLADVPTMLVPPIIYFVYAMVRGAIAGEYPYTIMEADRIGYGQVAINVFLVLVGLTLLACLAVALDRLLERARLPGA